MKVAVFLTGLVLDKHPVLPHIKTMFDLFAERNKIDIDYYCHFWNDTGIYPYGFDNTASPMKLPAETSTNIALDIIKPLQYTVSSFNESYDRFKSFFKYDPNNAWQREINMLLQEDHFNQNIHSRFFVDNYNDPHGMFDKWWYLHVRYCQFVHMISQPFASVKSNEMILKSGIEYDACIKWRYDVVADLKTNNDKFVKAIKDCSNETNLFCTELAWEGLNWKEDLQFDINSDHNKLVSLHDGWWISSLYTNNRFAKTMLPDYIDSLSRHKFDAQHVHFYDAVKGVGARIDLIDRIQHNIIRFPDTVPVNFNNNPHVHFEKLYNANFVAKRNSDYKRSISHWDKRAQYQTIKYFDFY